MKRVVLLLLVLLLLAAGAFYWFSRQGVTEGAQLVPAGSVLYVAVPDVRRSLERWPKTSLAQIGAEPAVADFLKKPMELAASKGGLEGLDLLFRVKPGRLFFAVTAVRETGGDLVLGFQYFGGRKDLDGAMDRLYREAEKMVPNAKRTTADYRGDQITTFAGAAPIFFSGTHGSWGFLSNSETALKQSLDRAAGRDKSPSLAASDDFKTVLGHLATMPDFAWFARLKPVVDTLITLGAKQSAGAMNTQQLAQLEKIKALGGTLLFDGANQKEATFILYPDAPKVPAVDRSPMAFTTPGTTFYYNATMDWSTVTSDEYAASLPPAAQAFLTGANIDLKQLPKMFGNDLGLIVNWPASSMIPSVLAVAEVKDRHQVEGLLEGLILKSGLPTTTSELQGARIFGLPAGKIQLVDPAVAVSDKFVFAALSASELERALSVAPGSATLESGEAFKPALAAYKADGQAFGYLDSKALFEGIYNRVRPIAIFAGAMSADVGRFVDVDKLPETEVISRHLSAIVYANRQLADGWLIESSGPITLSQAFFGGAVGASATYMSQALKNPQP
jgi:hypothetical protein